MAKVLLEGEEETTAQALGAGKKEVVVMTLKRLSDDRDRLEDTNTKN